MAAAELLVDSSTIVKRPKICMPKNDGESFVSSLPALESLVNTNRTRLGGSIADEKSSFEGDGDLSTLRKNARTELVDAAFRFTQNYSSPGTHHPKTRRWIFVTGHQPEMFHPGVWFKHFLLNQLGETHNATAVNLIIDNDECGEVSLAVPCGSMENPEIKKVKFDDDAAKLPFENRRWKSDSAFSGFYPQVKNSIGKISQHDLVLDRFCQLLAAARKESGLVGQSIARARHQLEIENGLRNVEVPFSTLCKGETFKQFLAAMLLRAKTLRKIYNDSLQQFRSAYKIRSQTHPVSVLREKAGWLEMPFWIWSNDFPARSPLFVRFAAQTIEISNLREIKTSLPASGLFESLAELESGQRQSLSIRPRALMTTLYARVFLADLFLHGIGGAKYDELTDLIIKRFYGIEPPGFLTATSTHFLPLGVSPIDEQDVRKLKAEIRQRQFHPEQFVHEPSASSTPELGSLVEEKQRLLGEIPPGGQKQQWHQKISSVNKKLLGANSTGLEQAIVSSRMLDNERRRRAILCSRDYSFVLHSPELIGKLRRLSAAAVNKTI